MNYSNLLKKYMEGEMTPPEAEAFKRELEKNKDLKQEYALLNEMNSDKFKKLFQFQSALDEVQNEFIAEKQAQNTPQKANIKTLRIGGGWYKIAAVFLLFISIGTFLIIDQIRYEGDIYSSFYQTYTLDNYVRSNAASSLNENWLSLYKSGEYMDFINKNPYLNTESIEPRWSFYLAMAYMETDKVDMAKKYLNPIVDSVNLFTTQAQWYLALCHIKDNEIELAKANLIALKDDRFYGERAKEILAKLED